MIDVAFPLGGFMIDTQSNCVNGDFHNVTGWVLKNYLLYKKMMTYKEFSDELDISYDTIYSWCEDNKIPLLTDNIIRVAHYFDVSLELLNYGIGLPGSYASKLAKDLDRIIDHRRVKREHLKLTKEQRRAEKSAEIYRLREDEGQSPLFKKESYV